MYIHTYIHTYTVIFVHTRVIEEAYGYFESKLRSLLAFDDLKPEVFQLFRFYVCMYAWHFCGANIISICMYSMCVCVYVCTDVGTYYSIPVRINILILTIHTFIQRGGQYLVDVERPFRSLRADGPVRLPAPAPPAADVCRGRQTERRPQY